MTNTTLTKQRRAIGVIRVSRTRGDDIRSPGEQRARIEAACANNGLRLIEVIEELDVSGGRALAKRPGLLRAVEAIEGGGADVIVVAYFDRLVRSLAVQAEVVDRIEKAGGGVLTVDVGEISNESAAKWMSASLLGLFAEYQRRSGSERTADSKRNAVDRGVAPFANIPPGIRRGKDRVLEQDPKLAPVVKKAFELRADGATIAVVRAHLAEHGIAMSYAGVSTLLINRLYRGELRFGAHLNENALPEIVDEHLFRRAGAVRVSKGRFSKSERLLARLGILRCGNCGSRLIVITSKNRSGSEHRAYRCGAKSKGDCSQRVSIAAELAEQTVVAEVKLLLAETHGGQASADGQVAALEAEYEQAVTERDATVSTLQGIPGEAVRAKLLELQERVDAVADALAEQRSALPEGREVVSAEDWDSFSFEQQRRLIRLTIERVDVGKAGPGVAGAARLTITPRS